MNRKVLWARSRRARLWVVVGVSLAVVIAIFMLPRIPQNQAYHRFADHRTFLTIPNFLNVISNVPFFLIGVLGLRFLWKQEASGARKPFVEPEERWAYFAFFAGVMLICFGSGYYHWAPSNERLLWDRLPMTLGFMSILAAVIAERVSVQGGQLSLGPLLVIGLGSVVYWRLSELKGMGDLRLYGLVQFCPLLLIPLLMLLFPPRYTRGADLLGVAAIYGLAHLFELFDARIFSWNGMVSGHTLKHLAAAAAVYGVLRMLQRRTPLAAANDPKSSRI